MIRHALYITLILLCCYGCSRQQEPMTETVVKSDTVPPLVTQIRQCSRIYTTEYKIHKIITHDDVIRLRGSFLAQDFNIRMPLGDR